MSFCHKCGSKINENNAFCTSCGAKQVSEAATENNQSGWVNSGSNPSFSDAQAKVVDSINNFKSGINASSLGDILLKMLVKPVLGAKNFVESCEKNSVIVITVLLAVVQGILGVWKVNQVLSTLQSSLIELFKQVAGFASIFSSSSSYSFNSSKEIMQMTEQINMVKGYLNSNMPYGKIFMQNAAIFIIGIITIFIAIILANTISNQRKISAFTIFKAAVIISAPIIYFEAFSIIVSYLSFYFGILVFYIGIIISISCLMVILKEQLEIDENLSVFVVAISFILSFIAIGLCAQNFVMSDFKEIASSIMNIFKNGLL